MKMLNSYEIVDEFGEKKKVAARSKEEAITEFYKNTNVDLKDEPPIVWINGEANIAYKKSNKIKLEKVM